MASAPGRALAGPGSGRRGAQGSHNRGRMCTVIEQTRHLPTWPDVAVAAGPTGTHRRARLHGSRWARWGRRQKPSDLGAGERRGQLADPGSGVACGGRGTITNFSHGPAPPAPRGCAGCKRRPGSVPGKGRWCTAFGPEPGAPVPRAECEGPAPQEEGPDSSMALSWVPGGWPPSPGTPRRRGNEVLPGGPCEPSPLAHPTDPTSRQSRSRSGVTPRHRCHREVTLTSLNLPSWCSWWTWASRDPRSASCSWKMLTSGSTRLGGLSARSVAARACSGPSPGLPWKPETGPQLVVTWPGAWCGAGKARRWGHR